MVVNYPSMSSVDFGVPDFCFLISDPDTCANFVPRLPSSGTPNGLSPSSGSLRITGSTSRRQRIFAVTQIAALAIAVVGVAGVLAFSVSARTPELGIRLALGSEPQRLLKGVITEGAVMAAAGVLAGAAFGFVLARLASRYFLDVKMAGALPVFVSAFALMAVAVIASALPAVRAARVDVMQALRSE
jgi:ABC-type antimicrobial peptide transport system permease subunit